MKLAPSACSPKIFRRAEMLLARLFSSTTVSCQTSHINWSLLTRRLRCLTSAHSVSKARSGTGIRLSPRQSDRSNASRRKASNSYNSFGACDFGMVHKPATKLHRRPKDRDWVSRCHGQVHSAQPPVKSHRNKLRHPTHGPSVARGYECPARGCLEIAPAIDRQDNLRKGRGRQVRLLAGQLCDQFFQAGIVADDHHRPGCRRCHGAQHGEDVGGTGRVKSPLESDVARIAGSLGHRLGGQPRPDRVRADDHIRGQSVFTHQLSHPRPIPPATRVQRPLVVIERRITPARFRVPQNQQGLHPLKVTFSDVSTTRVDHAASGQLAVSRRAASASRRLACVQSSGVCGLGTSAPARW